MNHHNQPIAEHPPRKGAWIFKHPPPKRAFIKSSSKEGRWDRMVLNHISETGTPHTSVFTDMWKGWGTCLRTVSQLLGNVQSFERGYSSRCLIDLPPPK